MNRMKRSVRPHKGTTSKTTATLLNLLGEKIEKKRTCQRKKEAHPANDASLYKICDGVIA